MRCFIIIKGNEQKNNGLFKSYRLIVVYEFFMKSTHRFLCDEKKKKNRDYIVSFLFQVSSQKWQRIGSRGRRSRYAGKKASRRRRDRRNAGHDGHDDYPGQRATPRDGRRRAGFVYRAQQDAAEVPAAVPGKPYHHRNSGKYYRLFIFRITFALILFTK